MSVTSLRRDRVRGVYRLIGDARDVLAASGRSAAEQHVVAGLAALIGARVVGIVIDGDHTPTSRGRVVSASVHGPDDANRTLLEAHRTAGSAIDPAVRLLMKRPAPAVSYCRQELVDDRTWYRDPYVAETCRSAGVDHSLYSRSFAGNLARGICLHRPLRDRAFNEEERSLVHLFHLEYDQLDPVRAMAPLAAVAGAPAASVDVESMMRSFPPRQREVLEWLVRGLTEKEVATQMRVSPHTVHHYVKQIYRVLGVGSRAALLVRAVGLGLGA